MTNPTHKQIIAMLAPWVERHAAIDAAFEPLMAGNYMSVDSPLFDAVWITFDRYTDALELLVGDKFGWLHWYQGENGMGASKLGASPRAGAPLRAIKSLSDLAWLIVESRV